MSDLPDIHDALFRLGDELAMEPDDWIDQLLASGALVEVTVNSEMIRRSRQAIKPYVSLRAYNEVGISGIHIIIAAAISDTDEETNK